MPRAIYFAPNRDEEFIPLLKALYPSAQEKKIETDDSLNGYHELVTATAEEALKLKTASDTLEALLEVLTYNDSRTLSNEEATKLRKFFNGNLARHDLGNA